MEPAGGSKQDAGVVNMTRAMEALSPWLNHPRRTIIQVEALVTAAAALLLLQLFFGSFNRRWHNSFVKYGLKASTKLMNPLIIYTLGIMQSSPIKNKSYPVWAAFLIMASAGTATVHQHDFYDSFYNKYMLAVVESVQLAFYTIMCVLLVDPNTYTLKARWDHPKQHPKMNVIASSYCVITLVSIALVTKFSESTFLAMLAYQLEETNPLAIILKKIVRRKQEEAADGDGDGACDSDPQSMKGYKYALCYRHLNEGGPWITIDQIWDHSANSAYLKNLCLSCALFRWLMRQRYFGEVCPGTSFLSKSHDFVLKKLLPSEGDFKRAFRIIELELGFCYDFFFTKYYYTFMLFNSPIPTLQSFVLLKVIAILVVGVLAIRKSFVIETPNPIIEVKNSEEDYDITLLVLGVTLLVELMQVGFYLASNWAQVSVACMYVKKHWYEPNAFIFGEVIGFLRRVMISGKLRNKIDQHSVIFKRKQPDPEEVSDAVKRAIARSLRSTYANNLTTDEETSVRLRNQMLGEYSWALKNFNQLEIMLIWHIATEYCNAISDDDPSSNHRDAHFFAYVQRLLRPDPRRNRIARDGHRGVAVHLSRYCTFLIESVPELLPYHQAYIREVTEKVTGETDELLGSCCIQSEGYYKLKNLQGTEEGDNPTMVFKKGVKLGKQLEKMADGDHWNVMEDFWAKKIIHAADLHYTTKQHMEHLENGGEFLTHIWALLAHAGILDRDKDQQDQGVTIPAPHV